MALNVAGDPSGIERLWAGEYFSPYTDGDVPLLKQRIAPKDTCRHGHVGQVPALCLVTCGPWLDVCGAQELLSKLTTAQGTSPSSIWKEVPAQGLLFHSSLSGGNEVKGTLCGKRGIKL
jgi:hypothetical protein